MAKGFKVLNSYMKYIEGTEILVGLCLESACRFGMGVTANEGYF